VTMAKTTRLGLLRYLAPALVALTFVALALAVVH
jgi:hypothetical protein